MVPVTAGSAEKGRRRALIVEDSPAASLILKRKLLASGFAEEVDAVESGEEGVEMVGQQRFLTFPANDSGIFPRRRRLARSM